MPKQNQLFSDTAPTATSASQALTALKIDASQLSPAQKRFNKLLAETETLAARIDNTRRAIDAHRIASSNTLTPLEQEKTGLLRQMVVWLDQRLQRKGLTAKQKHAARDILCDMAAEMAYAGDEAMKKLHDAHSDQSLDELEKDDAQLMQSFMEGVLGQKINTDGAPIDNLDDLMRAAMANAQKHDEAQQVAHAAHQSKRKKTPKQLKEQAQAQDADGALRSIYRQLASALHPDRETDPAEQTRKTALMKEANAAYERRDLLALLHLQMQAELVDAAHIAGLAKEKLAALTALLKERVTVLQREVYQLEMQAREEFDLPLYGNVTAVTLKNHLRQSEKELLSDIATMRRAGRCAVQALAARATRCRSGSV
jgi:hypothetical protein